MHVSVRIPSSEDKTVFFSLPKTNDYQNIRNPMYDHTSSETVSDTIYNNEILVSRSQSPFTVSFRYTPKLRREKIEHDLLLSEYSDKKHQLVRNTTYINGEHPKIQNIASSLFNKETHLFPLVKKAYDYCLEELTYGNPIEGLYSVENVLEEKVTDCGGFSVFLGSLLQAKQIPTRLVVGYVKLKSVKKQILSKTIGTAYTLSDFYMHAWLEALLPNNVWFPLDPSVEWRRNHKVSKREGGFGYLPKDRLVVSFGNEITFTLNKKHVTVPLLQNPQRI